MPENENIYYIWLLHGGYCIIIIIPSNEFVEGIQFGEVLPRKVCPLTECSKKKHKIFSICSQLFFSFVSCNLLKKPHTTYTGAVR